MNRFCIIPMLAIALSACAGKVEPIGGAPGLQVMEGNLPPPRSSDLYGPRDAYLIAPLDALTIDVFGVPELSNRKVRVDSSGRIAFPLIGSLEVAGMTPQQISTMLEQRLQSYIREPQVTIAFEESADRNFTVAGEVVMPGVYPVIGKASLIKAIALARGLDEFADARDVVVFRTVDGQKMATLYNLDAIQRGYYDDPDIYANDVVVVGDSDGRRLFKDIVGAATLVATPLTILLQSSTNN